MSSVFDDPGNDVAPPRRRVSRRPHRWIWVSLTVAALAVIAARAAVLATHTAPAPRLGATGPTLEHATAFTAANGRVTSLAAWQGKPLVLWFIAADCSSCAVSVPTMAKSLPAFAAAGTHVIAVDLYGDLPAGRHGLRYLRQFGNDTAGATFSDPAWTWGLASRELSERFDPTGTPDRYFVIDSSGRVTYRGSVPVSTIGGLLDHVKLAADIRSTG